MIDWKHYFRYEKGKIYWINKNKFARSIEIGDEAGTIDHTGYCHVYVNGRSYQRHRIIWEMFNGKIRDGFVIDHINHIRHDDRIENLREITPAENNKNASIRKDNKCGVVGVSFHKRCKKWYARIRHNGKLVNLYWGDSFDDAVKARKEAERIYNFHSNHGISLPNENTFCKPEAMP